MTTVKARAGELAHPRYVMFFIVLVTAPFLLRPFLPLDVALIGGFDIAAAAFITSLAGYWRRSSPATIRHQAARDDAGRVILLLLSATVVVVVTVALARLIFDKKALDIWLIAFLVGTLLAGWIFVNLVFAIHYAHIYYDRRKDGHDFGGLDFPGWEEPVFSDFVHFSFVIGMTCQTADIDITSAAIRKTVTLHGLFAFVFNLGILALTINVIAGLA